MSRFSLFLHRPNLSRRRRFSLPLMLACLCLNQMGCEKKLEPSPQLATPAVGHSATPIAQEANSTPDREGYVGSNACTHCHSEVAETYRKHPMSRTIQTIEEDRSNSLASIKNTRVLGKKRLFDVEIDQQGAMAHHERMFDASGELIFDVSVPMDYVVGSGRRAKAYLYKQGDLLFMSPLNWYTQSNTWDLAPGYQLDDPRRFDRRISEECLSCHAGRVAVKGRSENTFQSPAFFEPSIGCESCHGPGEKHVRHHYSNRDLGEPETIVNPAKLDSDRRESVCNVCHLQVSARIPRAGKSDLDFRPGQKLEEIWTFLDVERGLTEDGKTHSVNHVQQMRESLCFVKSEGRFGCTSCHNPHSVPATSDQPTFYRDKCLKCHSVKACHEEQDSRDRFADSCIECHMPIRHSSNIAHVTQTDHRVSRFKETAAEADTEHNDDTLRFFDNQNLRMSKWESNRAMGLAAWKYLSKLGKRPPVDLGKFLDQVLREKPNDGPVLIALGSIAKDNRQLTRARDYFELARQQHDKAEPALAGLVEIYYDLKEWDQALDRAERLISINPQLAMPHALRSDILKIKGNLAAGIEAAQRALELNPTLVAVREWLVKAYQETGNEIEWKRQEAILRRMRDARLPQ